LRTIYAELERLANHFGDIGFIMNDTGFSFGGSQSTRLREMIMQINENLTGHRFLRGVNTYGGVTKDIDESSSKILIKNLSDIEKDFVEIIDICEDTESVINRLKGTGILSKDTAMDYGVVGVAARASGVSIDTRIDFPYAAYSNIEFAKAVQNTCDVYARYRIRVQEVHSSINIIQKALKNIPSGSIKNTKNLKLKRNVHSLSVVEGWRGEIFYFVITNNEGEISRVVVRDASYLNWPAVPHAVTGNIVPDFPLINKSFNLSYSGNDR
jgi:Ni,Fe-hydrogenase III large subunit